MKSRAASERCAGSAGAARAIRAYVSSRDSASKGGPPTRSSYARTPVHQTSAGRPYAGAPGAPGGPGGAAPPPPPPRGSAAICAREREGSGDRGESAEEQVR
jgi:hypothetical protein